MILEEEGDTGNLCAIGHEDCTSDVEPTPSQRNITEGIHLQVDGN